MATEKWSEEELKYAVENRLEKSYTEIGSHLGRTRNAVMVKMNRMNLKLPEKYSFDRDFFEKIDTEEKSYWLGFIYADGYVSSETELGIHLAACDIDHLRKFNKSLSGNIKVFEFNKTLKVNNKTYKMASIRIYSKKIVEDLKNWGIDRNKSLTIKFPNSLPSDLIRHFIRGFFDGDGSISMHKEKNQIRCKFTCASKDFLDSLNSIFLDLGLHTYIMNKTKNNKSYNLGISGKFSNRKFLEYIFDDSSIFLKRKHDFYYNNKELLIYKYEKWNSKLPQ